MKTLLLTAIMICFISSLYATRSTDSSSSNRVFSKMISQISP